MPKKKTQRRKQKRHQGGYPKRRGITRNQRDALQLARDARMPALPASAAMPAASAAMPAAMPAAAAIMPAAAAAGRIYCGNNGNFSGLTNGTHVLGTRNKCLQKGKLVGYYLPPDPEYSGAYNPINVRHLHCADHNVIPPNHTIGTLTWCLSKGIGIGKARKAREHYA